MDGRAAPGFATETTTRTATDFANRLLTDLANRLATETANRLLTGLANRLLTGLTTRLNGLHPGGVRAFAFIGAIVVASSMGLAACTSQDASDSTGGGSLPGATPGVPHGAPAGATDGTPALATSGAPAGATIAANGGPSVGPAIELPARFDYETADSAPPPTTPDPDRSAERPNVLLVTLDTTRRDHLSCYGYPRSTTPHLAAFAADSRTYRFAHCVAAAPVTLPSHATILTGLEPFQHQVRNNGIHVLDDAHVTVAELLQQAGYATGAITGAFPVAARFGLGQGFDHYDDDLRNDVADTPVPQRTAEEVTRLGLAWLSEQASAGSDPWFLWLHYFDPHDPYAPPAPFDQAFPDAPYDNEIAYTDAHLGGLFRELKRRGLWDDTAIIVTADHGEGLGDHGEPTHSLFVYRTTIDVPLLIKLPQSADPWRRQAPADAGEATSEATNPATSQATADASQATNQAPATSQATSEATSEPRSDSENARTFHGLVATSDLAPTMLDIAGIERATYPAEMSGHSLLAHLRGEVERTYAYMETLVPLLDYGWSPSRAIQSAGAKLVLSTRPEYYDLDSDPGELRNLYDPESPHIAPMLEHLMGWIENDAAHAPVAMDPETIERLRSLGYIAGGGSAFDDGAERADAKDMLWVLDAFDEGRAHLLAPDLDAAAGVFESVLRKDPTNRFARRTLTWLLPKIGRPDAAAKLCRAIQQEEPDAADLSLIRLRLAEAQLRDRRPGVAVETAHGLIDDPAVALDARMIKARALARLGDLNEAIAVLERAEDRFPDELVISATHGRILERAGEWDEAALVYEQRLAEHGASLEVLTGLAAVRLQQQRAEEAVDYLRQALAADPTHPRANFNAALIEAFQGNQQAAMQLFLHAVKAEPGNIEYQVHLGNHCLANGLYEKAQEHLGRAVSLGDLRASTLAGLGFAEIGLGHYAAGRNHLEEALGRDPNPTLRQRIEKELAETPS